MTKSEMKQLKRDAKAMRRDEGIPYMACLDIVAKTYGFKHYNDILLHFPSLKG